MSKLNFRKVLAVFISWIMIIAIFPSISNVQFDVQAESIFTTYNLTETELIKIASLCQQEQGTAKGAAAEASLMANRFEMYGSKYSSVYDYARNSGWFAKAGTHMDKMNASNAVIEAVRNVLINGKRTLPKYIDEHDCFSDLKSCTNNGVGITITNRSQYEQFVTIINNVYGSKYTFYCFPTSSSDPFGYISEAKRSQFGDAYYDYDTGQLMGIPDPVLKWYDGLTPINLGDVFYARIRNQHTGWYFTETNTGNIEGQNIKDNNTQIWKFERYADGSYKISNAEHPNKVIDVDDWAKAGNGSNVQTYEFNTDVTTNQKFYIYNLDNAYYIRSECTDLAVDVDINNYPGDVAVWDKGSDWAPQKFDIEKIDYNGSLPVDIGDTFYARIKNQHTGWYFTETSTGNIEGQNIKDDNTQIWKFERYSDGSYKISNAEHPNKVIDVDDWAKTGNGSNVQTYEFNTDITTNQKFYIYNLDNAYYIKPICTNLFVDMDINNYPGDVAVWDKGNDWAPQKFDIEKNDYNGSLPVDIGDTFYARIRNQSTGWYFTETNTGNIEGQNIKDNNTQIWRFERYADGSYKISNAEHPNKVIDVDDWAKAGNGSNVQTYEFNTDITTNQKFYIYNLDNAYYIKPICTDLFVDMDINNYPGDVAVWDKGSDWAPQKFDIEEVSMKKSGDVNADGKFTVSDVVLLQKWILAVPDVELANWKAADLCEDDRLDIFDLCLMKRMLIESN